MTQSGTTTVSKAQNGVQEELPLEASLAPRGGVVVTGEGGPVDTPRQPLGKGRAWVADG